MTAVPLICAPGDDVRVTINFVFIAARRCSA